MVKYDLKDTCFLIYARIDSVDRLINLELVVNHILTNFDTSVLLWEIDRIPRIPKEIKELPSLSYFFIEDKDSIFHTTRYRNEMVMHCKFPYFFVCDSDVIAAPEALFNCTKLLRDNNHRILVYPYNGRFYNVPKNIRQPYKTSGSYDFLKNKEPMFTLWFEYSVGGIFGGRTQDFIKSGPDNEKIYGWGPDDKERYYRLKKQGFLIKQATTPLYHLYHDRKSNSWHANDEIKNKNYLEYLRVFGAN